MTAAAGPRVRRTLFAGALAAIDLLGFAATSFRAAKTHENDGALRLLAVFRAG
jgi:hypothetical protein